jgi:hypothetical protein
MYNIIMSTYGPEWKTKNKAYKAKIVDDDFNEDFKTIEDAEKYLIESDRKKVKGENYWVDKEYRLLSYELRSPTYEIVKKEKKL